MQAKLVCFSERFPFDRDNFKLRLKSLFIVWKFEHSDLSATKICGLYF